MSFWSNPLKSVTNWVSDPFKAAEHSVEAALPIAGAVIGDSLGGPLGAVAGAELGGTGSGMMQGESFGQAAESALPGAALAGVGSYVSPMIGGYFSSTFPETTASFNSTLNSLTPDLGLSSVDPALQDQYGPNYATGQQYGPQQAVTDQGSLPWQTTPQAVTAGAPVYGSAGDAQFVSNAQAATGGAGAGAGTAPPAAGPSTLSSLKSGNFGAVLKDLGVTPMQAIGGAGLVANAIKGSSKTGAEKNEAAIAGSQNAVGNEQFALAKAGQLAPGQMAAINQQLEDGITQIRSKYASMGMSGSTSEQQAISQLQNAAASTVANAIQAELNTGLTALGQADSATQALANQQIQSDNALTQAIAMLSGAPSGYGKTGAPGVNG